MIEYKDIEKANSEIETIDIKRKNKDGEVKTTKYAEVSERVLAYRKVYPNRRIETEILELTENSIRMKATVYNDENEILATGHAGETKSGIINNVSMIENCETSAVGRALGFAGFGIDGGIASEQEMKKVEDYKLANKKIEVYDKMHISESDAITILKSAIGDLMRKQGVVKQELEVAVRNQTWTELEDLNYQQLGMLENKLKSINNTSSDWHNLYNKNSKIKDVVPVNQEVIYKSSQYKFGQLALKQAGDDEIKRNDIIDYYLDSGVDITKEIK